MNTQFGSMRTLAAQDDAPAVLKMVRCLCLLIILGFLLWGYFVDIWVIWQLVAEMKEGGIKDDYLGDCDSKAEKIWTKVLVWLIFTCAITLVIPIWKCFAKAVQKGEDKRTIQGGSSCCLCIGCLVPACMIAHVTFNLSTMCKEVLQENSNNWWIAMLFITWTFLGSLILCCAMCCCSCCLG